MEEGQEHPLRPVCSANTGPGSRISSLLTNVITPCIEEFCGKDMAESTEDLQSKIEGLNSLSDEDREGLVVCSMDAKALFPSIKIERSSEAVRKLILESKIEIRGVNFWELSRYLAYLLSEAEVSSVGLTGLVMQRTSRIGRHPVVTGLELQKSWAKRVN